MGRAHLSSQFGIDNGPGRHRSAVPQPPKYVDAPFDLDADLDGPDVVYEAFLSPEEIRNHEENATVVVPARENAPSPLESVESDEGHSTVATEPVTRVQSPVRRDRSRSPDAAEIRRGHTIFLLLDTLATAREAALSAVNANIYELASIRLLSSLVGRVLAILRPHIEAALGPHRATMPDVDFLGRMFERSLVMDILLPAPAWTNGMAFTRADVLAVVDGAMEAMRGTEWNTSSGANAGQEDDLISDPGIDEEDATVNPPAQPVAERAVTPIEHGRRTIPEIVSRIAPAPSSRAATPSVVSSMDVDTDDESRSGFSSDVSSRGNVRSVYRTATGASFTPRIIRAQNVPTRPFAMAAGHDRFIPVERLRAPSPLR